MPRVCGIWCPKGDACKYKNRLVGKSSDESDLRSRLLQHLYASPCHADLDDAERNELAATAEVEWWDEEEWAQEVKAEDTAADDNGSAPAAAEDWHDKRPRYPQPQQWKRQRKGGGKGDAIATALKDGFKEIVASLPGAASSPQPAVATVPIGQLQNIIDQLTRAETAARQAARISQTAANVFEQDRGWETI